MIDTGVVPAVHLTPAGVSPTTHPGQTRVNRSLHDNAMALTTGPDGKLAITLPMGDKKLPGIAAEDIGKCARGIFERGAEFIGRSIGIAGQPEHEHHPTVRDVRGFAVKFYTDEGNMDLVGNNMPRAIALSWSERLTRV